MEMVIGMLLASILAFAMTVVLVNVNKQYKQQFFREHVIFYGNESMRQIVAYFKEATDVDVSSIQGYSRIRFKYSDDSVDVIRVRRDEGFFLNEGPLLDIDRRNLFRFEPESNIEYVISDFDVEFVPASMGVQGKLGETMYDLKLRIEVITRKGNNEIITPFIFHRQVFAVNEYLAKT